MHCTQTLIMFHRVVLSTVIIQVRSGLREKNVVDHTKAALTVIKPQQCVSFSQDCLYNFKISSAKGSPVRIVTNMSFC